MEATIQLELLKIATMSPQQTQFSWGSSNNKACIIRGKIFTLEIVPQT
jgi:hypothetical protein